MDIKSIFKENWKNVLILLFLSSYIVLAIVLAGNCSGTNAGQAPDLGDTIAKLSEENNRLKNLNQELERANGELRQTLDGLSETAQGADRDLSDALGTVRELKTLSEKIRN